MADSARKQSLRIPAGIVLPGVSAEDRAVHVGREFSFDVEAPRAEARRRNEGHQRQYTARRTAAAGSSPLRRRKGDERRRRRNRRRSAQHARDAHLRAVNRKKERC